MGEEAFDETVLSGDGDRVLFVRGGYSRDEVYIGIGRAGQHDPDVVVEVDGAELKRALRNMVIGEQRFRQRPHPEAHHEIDIEDDPADKGRHRAICACDWKGAWKASEGAAETSGAMHLGHARRRLDDYKKRLHGR